MRDRFNIFRTRYHRFSIFRTRHQRWAESDWLLRKIQEDLTGIFYFLMDVYDRFYNANNSIILNLTIRVYYQASSVVDENNLRLYQNEYPNGTNSWNRITNNFTINPTQNYIEFNISSLCYFVLAEYIEPTDEKKEEDGGGDDKGDDGGLDMMTIIIIVAAAVGGAVVALVVIKSKGKKEERKEEPTPQKPETDVWDFPRHQ